MFIAQSQKRYGGGPEARGLRMSAEHRKLIAAACIVFFAALPGAVHAGTVYNPKMDAASRVDVRLESWLESMPTCGYVPVKIHIRNGSDRAHTWTISATNGYGMGGGVRAYADLTVDSGRAGERMFYAPVTAQPAGGFYYGMLNFSVTGPGVAFPHAGSMNVTRSSGRGTGRTGFIAMSKMLATNHWSQLRGHITSTAKSTSTYAELDGSEVDMAQAPDDWRGYSGLAQLWMEEGEWLAVRPSAKAAMLDWVALGGRVYVLATENSEARARQLGLPPQSGGVRRHGAGDLTLMPWNGTSMPMEDMAREVRRSDTGGLATQIHGYNKHWGLRTLAGELAMKSGLIFGFIAIFGILVGPVNLFWLAPAGRRQRMFWTTPLLSLGGSLLLVAIMLLQDGIGGNGARLTLAILQPEQKRLAVIQEQASRTGVLVARSFPVTEQGWMQPLDLVKTSSRSPINDNRHQFSVTDTTRSGDWFASRSIQAHLLATARPSRAAIEVHVAPASKAPSVLSNVESHLKILFIVDESGAVWKTSDLGAGEKRVLASSTRGEFDAWRRDGFAKHSGPVIHATLAQLGGQKGCAFAEAADASKLAVPTLGSIRWTHDFAIIAGPYTTR